MKPWARDFVAWDTETTGLGDDARVIEVAAVRFVEGQVASIFSTRCNPCLGDHEWSDEAVRTALRVNCIAREHLEPLRSFQAQADAIMIALRSSPVVVAHNTRFDERMLAGERRRSGALLRCLGLLAGGLYPIPNARLCSMGLDLALRPEAQGRSLVATCERWNVPLDEAHRALSDAMAVGNLLLLMEPELPDELPTLLAQQELALNRREAKYKNPSERKKAGEA